MMTYTLYHVTARAAAENNLANGFALGKTVELSSSPWRIGTTGDTAIRVVIDLDEQLVSGRPGEKRLYHVGLEPETLNREAELTIVDSAECNRLRSEFDTPGDPTLG